MKTVKVLVALFFIFLILGLAFSAPFPATIDIRDSTITMILFQSEGNVSNGSAVYIIPPKDTPAGDINMTADKAPGAAAVRTLPKSHKDFFKQQYTMGVWKNTTETGAECYYICGFDAGTPTCNMDCHDGNNTFYFISANKNNEALLNDTFELDMVLNDTLAVAKAVIKAEKESSTTVTTPLNNESAGGAGPKQEDKTKPICPISVILIILSAAVFINKT